MMANNIEKLFVYHFIQEIPRGGKILEFGCGNDDFINNISGCYNVTGIDLYERTSSKKGFRFLKGDFLELNVGEGYTCVYGISSFEHIGLESPILPLDEIHKKIAATEKKLREILKPNGILFLTMPWGDGKPYYVKDDGSHTENPEEAEWGAMRYNFDLLNKFFSKWKIEVIECHVNINGKYYTISDWEQKDPKDAEKIKGVGNIILLKMRKK